MNSSRARATSRALALAVLMLISTVCVLIGAPVFPREWPSAATSGKQDCPDLGGTFAVSGRESGMLTFFWGLPVWWSSNSDSIARLDKDLGLRFRDRWPAEIEGADVLRLVQRDPAHLRISMLRHDGNRIEGVSDMTFARVSHKLEDRARDFECRKGRIEFAYAVDQGEAPPSVFSLKVGRASDGALLTRISKTGGFPPLSLVHFSTWRRYELVPIAEPIRNPLEAPLDHVDAP